MKDNSFDSEAFSLDDSETNKETEDMNEEKNINNLELIKVISDILSAIIEENEKLPNIKQIILKQKKMCFSEKAIPNILIYDYLKRIQEYTFIERNTLILSLIYIDRLCTLGQITLTYYNIHRILFGAILISIKYNEDTFYGNKYYAEIAGVKINELNSIEYNFILLCNYDLFVSDEIFKHYNAYLISSSEIKKSISSGKEEF
jgi:hypothetical protein